MINLIMSYFSRLSVNQRGVTMIEYALIAALIAVVAIVALTNIGTEVKTTFECIVLKLQGSTCP
jgi:pilus assembly protein Flp/PilA